MYKLFAARFDNSFSSPKKLEDFHEFANLAIAWALPGGVQRMELMILASSKEDAAIRYQRHLGHRIVIYDNFVDKPVASGQIYDVIPRGRYIVYVCAGAWKRHYDQYYTVDDMADLTLPTDDTDVVVKDILDDTVTVLGTDQTAIAATSLNIGAWHVDGAVGLYAGDAIAELATIGTSGGTPVDYYVKERPFVAGLPQAPVPVLETRTKAGTPTWLIGQSDFVQGGLEQSRNIWNFKSDVQIGYGVITGTHTSAGTSTTVLTDSAASFIADGVTVGDIITNITDGSVGEVATVTSATSLTVHVLVGGTSNDFSQNDVYGLRMNKVKWTASATSAKADVVDDYWTVEYREVQQDMDATHAAAYRTAILDMFDEPVQQQAFTVGAPTIRGSYGQRWPLWRMIAENGGYLRLTDIKPGTVDTAFSTSDRVRNFRIAALEYDYKSNTMRIQPDLPSTRLDAILKQAGLIAGQLISSMPEMPPSGAELSGKKAARTISRSLPSGTALPDRRLLTIRANNLSEWMR